MAQIGAIDGQDVREQLRRDKDSDYFGLVDDEPIDDLLTPDDDTPQPPPLA